MNILLSVLVFLGLLTDVANLFENNSEKKASNNTSQNLTEPPLLTGAEQLDLYIPLLKGKKVALVVNQTSLVGKTHLVDTLLSLNIDVCKVFAPEHGFRGDIDAGATVQNAKDTKTGLPVISLYGETKKPTYTHLQDVDIVIFDIQDVGARFYTYISTMHYVMEACAENQKTCIILDRPNPNGDYIAGPILDMRFKSFVGMHPIPIVHGLTVGELAMMINGENWLKIGKCDLTVVKMQNYTHQTPYSLPIKPSPNLPNDLSIRLYPSLCLFEGTSISVGRGTYFPFQVLGYPDARMGNFQFTPQSIAGMSSSPLHQNKTCFGIDFRGMENPPKFTIQFLIDFYNKFPDKSKFFNGYFDTLVGNVTLRDNIKAGLDAKTIEKSWERDLQEYAALREKYLLYP